MLDLFSFVDTETSGLWRDNLPADDPSQPNLLQLACKTVTADRRCVGRFSRIIRPDGWSIEPQAEAVHGISERLAYEVGIALEGALYDLKVTVENSTLIVGHNLFNFDDKVINAAIRRAGVDGLWWRGQRRKFYDTQEAATPVLKIPGQYDDYKFPSLEEAHNFFLDDAAPNWTSKHDAEDDMEACEFVFWSLRERKNG